MIAFYTHLNHSSVKVNCRRLAHEGKILCPTRGIYRSINTLVRLDNEKVFVAELFLHGIKLEYRGELCNYIYTHPYLIHGNYTTHRHKKNHSITHNEEWEGRTVSFTTHKVLIELFIYCSHKPLSLSEFKEFCQYLRGKENRITEDQWFVIQHDFGTKDTDLLSMQGIQRISLRIFKNLWITMYNRYGKLRIEANFVHKELPLDKCLEVYSKFCKSINEVIVK